MVCFGINVALAQPLLFDEPVIARTEPAPGATSVGFAQRVKELGDGGALRELGQEPGLPSGTCGLIEVHPVLSHQPAEGPFVLRVLERARLVVDPKGVELAAVFADPALRP